MTSNFSAQSCSGANKWRTLWAEKKLIATHTYHSDEMKKAFWEGTYEAKKNDIEWIEGFIFNNCQCTAC